MAEKYEAKKPQVKEFLRKYWPGILAGTVAAGTAVGVAIFLTARYLKEREEQSAVIDLKKLAALEQIERESVGKASDMHLLLETGTGLGRAGGGVAVSDVATMLSLEVESPEVAEVLDALSAVVKTNSKKV